MFPFGLPSLYYLFLFSPLTTFQSISILLLHASSSHLQFSFFSNMVLKVSHKLYSIFCLSILFFLLFHILYTTFHSNIGSSTIKRNSFSRPSIRKSLASNFDFTPFYKNHNHHRKNLPAGHMHTEPAAGSEIDPRYGVEKRLVPNGPNPLHH